MKELVFFLEEESAKALLKGLLDRLLAEDDIPTRYVVFEGKGDLHRQLERKLRGYSNRDARFIVIRDKDTGNCQRIKGSLAALSQKAGRPETIVAIPCHEIEAFYLGDLRAVGLALGIPNLARHQQKAKFRNPDLVEHPARVLDEITGYRYRKVAHSRAIAPHLDIENPRSPSFRYLLRAIQSATH